jgi:hypothetical protein
MMYRGVPIHTTYFTSNRTMVIEHCCTDNVNPMSLNIFRLAGDSCHLLNHILYFVTVRGNADGTNEQRSSLLTLKLVNRLTYRMSPLFNHLHFRSVNSPPSNRCFLKSTLFYLVVFCTSIYLPLLLPQHRQYHLPCRL